MLNKNLGSFYIIDFGNNHVKIGSSKFPEKRIKTLSLQSGLKVVNHWISPPCYNFKEKENELHKIFEKERRKGEYFNIQFNRAIDIASKLNVFLESEIENEKRGKLEEQQLKKITELINSLFVIEEEKGSDKFITIPRYQCLMLLESQDSTFTNVLTSIVGLFNFDNAENIASLAMKKGMEELLDYHDIYTLAKQKVTEYAQSVSWARLN